MSPWVVAAAAMMAALVPAAIRCFRGDPVDRLVGLETAGVIVPQVLLLLAEAFARPAFFDLALTAALLAFGSGLVFARFLERWL